MFYFVTVTRNGKTFYVVSPKFNVFELSETKTKNTFLWESQESCKKDGRWKHLLKTDDKIEYHRTT